MTSLKIYCKVYMILCKGESVYHFTHSYVCAKVCRDILEREAIKRIVKVESRKSKACLKFAKLSQTIVYCIRFCATSVIFQFLESSKWCSCDVLTWYLVACRKRDRASEKSSHRVTKRITYA